MWKNKLQGNCQKCEIQMWAIVFCETQFEFISLALDFVCVKITTFSGIIDEIYDSEWNSHLVEILLETKFLQIHWEFYNLIESFDCEFQKWKSVLIVNFSIWLKALIANFRKWSTFLIVIFKNWLKASSWIWMIVKTVKHQMPISFIYRFIFGI